MELVSFFCDNALIIVSVLIVFAIVFAFIPESAFETFRRENNSEIMDIISRLVFSLLFLAISTMLYVTCIMPLYGFIDPIVVVTILTIYIILRKH
jgi:hypothetical protein